MIQRLKFNQFYNKNTKIEIQTNFITKMRYLKYKMILLIKIFIKCVMSVYEVH